MNLKGANKMEKSTIWMPREMIDGLNSISEFTKIPKSEVIRTAINKLLNSLNGRKIDDIYRIIGEK